MTFKLGVVRGGGLRKGSGKAEKNSKFQQFGSLCQLRKRILVKNCFNLDICSIIR